MCSALSGRQGLITGSHLRLAHPLKASADAQFEAKVLWNKHLHYTMTEFQEK